MGTDPLLCGACSHPISDRYIMKVGDSAYHERCLVCSVCRGSLSHTCFSRDGKLFCRLDYERLYGKKCLGCSESVGAGELVMRAVEAVFHLRCFLCVVCGVRLQKGDQFVVKKGQLFCRSDYEKEVEMFQSYVQIGESLSGGELSCEEVAQPRPVDGRRGPKRPRTILTTQQRRAFKASFEQSPKPCRKVREGLAKDTGLSVRIVQVWFQNQRAKMKKIQKKARLDAKNNNASSDCLGDKSDRIKDEELSRGYMNDSCSDTESREFRSAKEYLQVKDETVEKEEGFFKSMQSVHYLDTREVQMKQEHSFLGGGNFSQMETNSHPYNHGIGLNPIDRLYSMQSSYFCSEDISDHQ